MNPEQYLSDHNIQWTRQFELFHYHPEWQDHSSASGRYGKAHFASPHWSVNPDYARVQKIYIFLADQMLLLIGHGCKLLCI